MSLFLGNTVNQNRRPGEYSEFIQPAPKKSKRGKSKQKKRSETQFDPMVSQPEREVPAAAVSGEARARQKSQRSGSACTVSSPPLLPTQTARSM